MKMNNISCKNCRYVKYIAISKQMYYCDNENRTDDMGKLGENELPETVPEWCPLRKD